jgi:hypothetical protein
LWYYCFLFIYLFGCFLPFNECFLFWIGYWLVIIIDFWFCFFMSWFVCIIMRLFVLFFWILLIGNVEDIGNGGNIIDALNIVHIINIILFRCMFFVWISNIYWFLNQIYLWSNFWRNYECQNCFRV